MGLRKGNQRFTLTIPPEISRFLDPERVYEVTLTPLGSVSL